MLDHRPTPAYVRQARATFEDPRPKHTRTVGTGWARAGWGPEENDWTNGSFSLSLSKYINTIHLQGNFHPSENGSHVRNGKSSLNTPDTQGPRLHCREKRLWPTSETTDWKVVQQSLRTALKYLGNNVHGVNSQLTANVKGLPGGKPTNQPQTRRLQ